MSIIEKNAYINMISNLTCMIAVKCLYCLFHFLLGPIKISRLANPLRKGIYEGTGRLFFEFYTQAVTLRTTSRHINSGCGRSFKTKKNRNGNGYLSSTKNATVGAVLDTQKNYFKRARLFLSDKCRSNKHFPLMGFSTLYEVNKKYAFVDSFFPVSSILWSRFQVKSLSKFKKR